MYARVSCVRGCVGVWGVRAGGLDGEIFSFPVEGEETRGGRARPAAWGPVALC